MNISKVFAEIYKFKFYFVLTIYNLPENKGALKSILV